MCYTWITCWVFGLRFACSKVIGVFGVAISIAIPVHKCSLASADIDIQVISLCAWIAIIAWEFALHLVVIEAGTYIKCIAGAIAVGILVCAYALAIGIDDVIRSACIVVVTG